MSKVILITGGCGFVGSNLCILLKKNYPDYNIIAMDNLKRRGSELSINRLKNFEIEFIHGDIRIKEDFEPIKNVDFIIDAAAEPSVLAGLEHSTDYLINTNFNGTINCINLALKHNAGFIFLSTSRVYPIARLEKAHFTETSSRFKLSENQDIEGISEYGVSEKLSLDGVRSLYGASKLASELIINEYINFLGLKGIINRCGVITGPFQMGKVDQGVVVLWMARHFWKKPLKYIGYGGLGKQVRDILHISDLYALIDHQLHNFQKYNGSLFNVGGGLNSSVSLLELTKICEEITGNQINIEPDLNDRPADLRIYLTDHRFVTKETGWKPKIKPFQILEDIYMWIKKEEEMLVKILN